jgi:hypothetical protein
MSTGRWKKAVLVTRDATGSGTGVNERATVAAQFAQTSAEICARFSCQFFAQPVN